MTKQPSLKDQFASVQPGDVGIIGDPVEHSLSPLMQNAAFKIWRGAFKDREKPAPTYHRFLVKSDQLKEAIDLMKFHKIRGLNVTVPHKMDVYQFVDEMTPFVQRTRAINTLTYDGTKLSGQNTDAEGFKKALAYDMDYNAEGKTALVLGAGGTGVVLANALLDLSAEKVYVWNRSAQKLEALMKTAEAKSGKIVGIQSTDEVANAVKESQMIVNATSVGLKEGDGMPAEGLAFSPRHFVFDVVYHRETAFLAEAKKVRAKTSNGLGMLVYQGAKSFEIWTGSPAPTEVMFHAISQAK